MRSLTTNDQYTYYLRVPRSFLAHKRSTTNTDILLKQILIFCRVLVKEYFTKKDNTKEKICYSLKNQKTLALFINRRMTRRKYQDVIIQDFLEFIQHLEIAQGYLQRQQNGGHHQTRTKPHFMS